jgi:hypothetical protein
VWEEVAEVAEVTVVVVLSVVVAEGVAAELLAETAGLTYSLVLGAVLPR